MRHSLFFAICLLLLSCSSIDDTAPFDTPGKGFLALTWRMHPDSAKARMLEMPGVTVWFDTLYTFEGDRYSPIFRGGDSVDILAVPARDEWSSRNIYFHGGSFLGDTGVTWGLGFPDTLGLRDVTIILPEVERNKRRIAVMRTRFEGWYVYMDASNFGPSGTMYRYASRGMSGSSDTTMPADTYVSIRDSEYNQTLTVDYADKAYRDGWTGREIPKRVRVSIGEFERMKNGDR